MRYRALSPTGDYTFGQGQANFLINSPDAVAQLVDTRLRLWLGQWFLNLPDGTPYQTQVLGKYTVSTRDVAIQGRILQTQGVLGIKSYSSILDRNTRVLSINALLDTIYGVTAITTKFPFNVPVSIGR